MSKEDNKYDELSKRVKKLEEQAKFGSKKERVKRQPSTYNIFISKKIKQLKKDNPNLEHKEHFGMAVVAWNKEKEKD